MKWKQIKLGSTLNSFKFPKKKDYLCTDDIIIKNIWVEDTDITYSSSQCIIKFEGVDWDDNKMNYYRLYSIKHDDFWNYYLEYVGVFNSLKDVKKFYKLKYDR